MPARPKKEKAPVDAEITEEPATGADPSTMDLTDEQAAAPQEESTLQWPENTETRDLPFDYDDEALAGRAHDMANIIKDREATKLRAKLAAAAYKSEIDEYDEELAKHATDIKIGKASQSVLCRWHYETSGKSDEGFIYHPEMKTLVREDTGEVVTIAPITPEERQMEMTLGGQPGEWWAPDEALGLPGPGESEAGAPAADADEPKLED